MRYCPFIVMVAIASIGLFCSPTLVFGQEPTENQPTSVVFGANGSAPQVKTNGQGDWIVSWQDRTTGEIVMTRSSDNGRSWSAPSTPSALKGNEIDSWDMAADESGTWLLIWEGQLPLGSSLPCMDAYSRLCVSQSTDGGNTWSSPQILAAQGILVGSSGRPLRHSGSFQIVESNGQWILLHSWNPQNRLLITRSDDGTTWSKPTVIAELPDHPRNRLPLSYSSLAADRHGNLVALMTRQMNWFHVRPENSNIFTDDTDVLFVASSSDNGASWSEFTRLHPDFSEEYWHYINSPPEVSTDGEGNWLIAWDELCGGREGKKCADGWARTDMPLLISRSTDMGRTWSFPSLHFYDKDDLTREMAFSFGTGAAIHSWDECELERRDGNFYCSDFSVHSAFSTDVGQEWQAMEPLFSAESIY